MVVMPVAAVGWPRDKGRGIRFGAVWTFIVDVGNPMLPVAVMPGVGLRRPVMAFVAVGVVGMAVGILMVIALVVVAVLRRWRGVMVVSVPLVSRAGNERTHVNLRGRRVAGAAGLLRCMDNEIQPLLLLRHQVGIKPPGGDQFHVVARFHQAAVVKDQDPVGVDHAGKAVGNPQGGPTHNQPVQGLHYYRLVLRIDAGECLVQNEYGGVLQQGSGDGNALLLPTRQPDGPLAHHRVVTIGQMADELVGIGGSCGLLHLRLGRVRISESQVLCHRPMEQVGVLGDHGDLLPQSFERYFSQVAASHPDDALLRVEEPEDQPNDGGLASAAGPDKTQGLSLVEGKREIVQGGPASLAVGMTDVFEGDLRFQVPCCFACRERPTAHLRGRGLQQASP